MYKNVHPVYRVGIWTYNLLNMSLLTNPLDHTYLSDAVWPER